MIFIKYEIFNFNKFYNNVFLKTGNVLSEKSIFNVNNIEIETKNYIKNNDEYLNQAFIEGFNELTKRILLKKDIYKIKKTSIFRNKRINFTLSNR